VGGKVQLDLTGKAAVVTGGSRGIGAAIARSLAAAGVSVLVTFRQDAAAYITGQVFRVDGGLL
jgi:NAD(P)-dependent dehydrogenase (short-subunit alcohol dehydrogenase family)